MAYILAQASPRNSFAQSTYTYKHNQALKANFSNTNPATVPTSSTMSCSQTGSPRDTLPLSSP